jgi:hypothetical protein
MERLCCAFGGNAAEEEGQLAVTPRGASGYTPINTAYPGIRRAAARGVVFWAAAWMGMPAREEAMGFPWAGARAARAARRTRRAAPRARQRQLARAARARRGAARTHAARARADTAWTTTKTLVHRARASLPPLSDARAPRHHAQMRARGPAHLLHRRLSDTRGVRTRAHANNTAHALLAAGSSAHAHARCALPAVPRCASCSCARPLARGQLTRLAPCAVSLRVWLCARRRRDACVRAGV